MKAMTGWPKLWSKAGSVSIRAKVMGIVAIGIVVSSSAIIWYDYLNATTMLSGQLRERGIAIANSLAAQGRDLILTNNHLGLYTLVENTHHADTDITYIFVLDAGGDVLVHTFEQGFPSGLLGKNETKSAEPYRVQALNTEEGIIQDVAVPVLGGKAGIVRVGMSEAGIRSTITRHVREAQLWMVLYLVLGLYATYAITSFLTKPISQLAKAAQAVGNGDFNWTKPAWANDEIGSLGVTFSEVNEELRRRKEMQERLLSKVIGAQEEERKRIARELHDETGQALASMKIGLKNIEDTTDSTDVKEKTAGLREIASHLLEATHRLSIELRPSLLDDLGLVAAIQKYCKEYSTKTNINIDFHTSGLDLRSLAPDTEIAVFRIIQEALTNVVKYAEASNVSVVLECRNSSLIAIVEDDGKGFDVKGVMASPSENKLGLFGMQERASLLGGKLTIESDSGAGTSVFLEVPLKFKEGIDEKDKSAFSR